MDNINGPMPKPFAEKLKALRKLADSKDIECAHIEADDLLCEILLDLGYDKIVEAYEAIDKWYA